jgi:ankyrin repeat protein
MELHCCTWPLTEACLETTILLFHNLLFDLFFLKLFSDDEYSALFLLGHGVSVNVERKFDQNSPLHLASMHSNLDLVAEKLLDNRAQIDATNIDGL